MNYYNLLRYALKVSPRLRILGIIVMHLLHRRYVILSVDPYNGCNYKCRMCYRSNSKQDKSNDSKISKSDISKIIKSFGRETMKLQIGCALEPSMAFSESMLLLSEAKKAKIGFISMTTNGVLLTFDNIKMLAEAGLNELIISCHGIYKETYEYFMRGKYERFIKLLDTIAEVRNMYPAMSLRINYTMNADNTEELKDFFSVFGKVKPNILQLRPIQNIGSTDYTNYDLTKIRDLYPTVILPLVDKCKKEGINVIVPDMDNIDQLERNNGTSNILNEIFQKNTQAYFSPSNFYMPDYDINKDTYRSYSNSHGKIKKLFKTLFMFNKNVVKDSGFMTKSMNYKMQ